MFTGLIAVVGTIVDLADAPPGKRLRVSAGSLVEDAKVGDSIAVSGCCLSIVEIRGDVLAFDAGPETLSRTTLGRLQPGASVNLEPSLRLSDRLGGHFVAGHVDGVGSLIRREDQSDWSTLWFDFPPRLAVEMASKGSIAIDGVSLTLVDVDPAQFSVALIPLTLAHTTLGQLTVGDQVNLETDLLAKYVARSRQ